VSVRLTRTAAERAIAIAIAVLLVTAGMLGLRHEADGAHVRDPLTGVMLHAHALSGAHVDSSQSDVHGRADDHDADNAACALDVAMHQAAAVGSGPTQLAARVAATFTHVELATARVTASSSVLRIAPKTSPPQRG
jgi:hypothetical protein